MDAPALAVDVLAVNIDHATESMCATLSVRARARFVPARSRECLGAARCGRCCAENPESPQRESGPDDDGSGSSPGWNPPHPSGAQQPNHEPRRGRTDPRGPDRVRSAYREARKARAGLIPRGRRRHREARRPRSRRDHRRPAPPRRDRPPRAPIAAPNARADPVDLAPFVGKAGFFIRYPAGWVRATDRPGTDNGKSETLALVGNFKDIDTVSVRREPVALHRDFAEAAAAEEAGETTGEDGGRR